MIMAYLDRESQARIVAKYASTLETLAARRAMSTPEFEQTLEAALQANERLQSLPRSGVAQ
jgi:hypothetical protein